VILELSCPPNPTHMSSSAISPSRQLFWSRCIRTITLTLLILASSPLTLLAIALSFELEDIYFTNAVCHTIADVSVSVLSALAYVRRLRLCVDAHSEPPG
jgi:hypothetical protein